MNTIKQEKYNSLLRAADKAKENSYSPYSDFKVGATILTKDGKRIDGCNVENAAYGSTMCAERAAIYKAVSLGYKPGDFEAIAIVSSGKNFSPCGACRQTIAEYEFKQSKNIEVFFTGETGNIVKANSLKDLLPFAFDNSLL